MQPSNPKLPDWDETPLEVIDAARLLLEWAGPTRAWSVLNIGVSDHGEVQQRLSEQLAINANLRVDVALLNEALRAGRCWSDEKAEIERLRAALIEMVACADAGAFSQWIESRALLAIGKARVALEAAGEQPR